LAGARSELNKAKKDNTEKDLKISQLIVQLEKEKKKLSEFEVVNMQEKNSICAQEDYSRFKDHAAYL
jgi:hypothetical protein